MSEGMGSSSGGSRCVARGSKTLAPLSSVSVQALQRHSCCWVLCVEALEYPVFEHCVQGDRKDGHKSEDGCILQPWKQQCVPAALCAQMEDSCRVCSSSLLHGRQPNIRCSTLVSSLTRCRRAPPVFVHDKQPACPARETLLRAACPPTYSLTEAVWPHKFNLCAVECMASIVDHWQALSSRPAPSHSAWQSV